MIKSEGIKLVINFRGSSKERDFDIKFKPLNNLSAGFSTIKELEEAFLEMRITKISHNDTFKI